MKIIFSVSEGLREEIPGLIEELENPDPEFAPETEEEIEKNNLRIANLKALMDRKEPEVNDGLSWNLFQAFYEYFCYLANDAIGPQYDWIPYVKVIPEVEENTFRMILASS